MGFTSAMWLTVIAAPIGETYQRIGVLLIFIVALFALGILAISFAKKRKRAADLRDDFGGDNTSSTDWLNKVKKEETEYEYNEPEWVPPTPARPAAVAPPTQAPPTAPPSTGSGSPFAPTGRPTPPARPATPVPSPVPAPTPSPTPPPARPTGLPTQQPQTLPQRPSPAPAPTPSPTPPPARPTGLPVSPFGVPAAADEIGKTSSNE